MEYSLSVPASRGRMGKSEFYTAVFPMGAVGKLFAYDPEKMQGLSPDERTQRALKRNRIPEIANYILENDDYVFSSITVSIAAGKRVKFEPVERGADIGILRLPLDCEYTVNDGQHRVAGIVEAISQKPKLEQDNISVVIFPGSNRQHSQQVFSDLNRTVLKTSRSLDILFDHRDPINRITVALAETVPLFVGRVDMERTALSGRSHEFTTLGTLQAATVKLLGTVSHDVDDGQFGAYLGQATDYWNALTGLIPPWEEIAHDELRPDEARATYVSVYSLVVWALGAVGGTVLRQDPGNWRAAIKPLADIDWTKANKEWQGICMVGAEVVTRGPARKATADLLHYKLGLGRKPTPVLGQHAPAPKPRARKAAK